MSGRKERTSSNSDDGDESRSISEGKSKGSTLDLAIVYIRALQRELPMSFLTGLSRVSTRLSTTLHYDCQEAQQSDQGQFVLTFPHR